MFFLEFTKLEYRFTYSFRAELIGHRRQYISHQSRTSPSITRYFRTTNDYAELSVRVIRELWNVDRQLDKDW